MAERGNGRPKATTWIWPERDIARPAPGTSLGLQRGSLDLLRAWVRAEAGPGRLLPWVAVAFGSGIALYFAAAHEPIAWVAVATAAGLSLAALLLRGRAAFPVLLLLAALAAGFATVSLKAARMAHAVLAKPIYAASLQGFVATREERERTDRFVLRLTKMDALGPEGTFERVRLSVKKGTAPDVGSFVELKARLQPPLQPLRPGSYDFARDLYFQGISASGFVLGAIKALPPPVDGGWKLRYAATMQGLRDAIDRRIRLSLEGDTRAIATALLTGRRDAISTPVNDAMFVSGLGHVLSISGYHMAIVAGAVFFAVRALLALSPALTVASPIKKWAAVAALAAAAFYLLLSGAEVATQRSFLMTAVVLVAVMADRRAITFRTLALAALVVLVVAPEALVHPSFQMSFAATLGLVALVQIGMPALFASPDHSATARAALWGGREIAMLALASLVAGLATMPYAAFHFHRISPYGVIANLLAMPVVSVLVMPAGLFGLVAMPFGFDGVFWRVMSFGIEWMIAVAQGVAALPGAALRIAAFGPGPLLAASAGIILLGLLRTPLRFAGVAVVTVAVLWALGTTPPAILIAGDGQHVAVRGRDGYLRVMQSGKDAFLLKEWLGADADARVATDPALTDGVSCDDEGCVAPLGDGALVALAIRAEALADDCARSKVIVTARQAPSECAALVIDRERLRRDGALALRRDAGGFFIESVRPAGTNRPWSPAPVEGASSGGTPASSARSRPIDATPAETDRSDPD